MLMSCSDRMMSTCDVARDVDEDLLELVLPERRLLLQDVLGHLARAVVELARPSRCARSGRSSSIAETIPAAMSSAASESRPPDRAPSDRR